MTFKELDHPDFIDDLNSLDFERDLSDQLIVSGTISDLVDLTRWTIVRLSTCVSFYKNHTETLKTGLDDDAIRNDLREEIETKSTHLSGLQHRMDFRKILEISRDSITLILTRLRTQATLPVA